MKIAPKGRKQSLSVKPQNPLSGMAGREFLCPYTAGLPTFSFVPRACALGLHSFAAFAAFSLGFYRLLVGLSLMLPAHLPPRNTVPEAR